MKHKIKFDIANEEQKRENQRILKNRSDLKIAQKNNSAYQA